MHYWVISQKNFSKISRYFSEQRLLCRVWAPSEVRQPTFAEGAGLTWSTVTDRRRCTPIGRGTTDSRFDTLRKPDLMDEPPGDEVWVWASSSNKLRFSRSRRCLKMQHVHHHLAQRYLHSVNISDIFYDLWLATTIAIICKKKFVSMLATCYCFDGWLTKFLDLNTK